jgi:hypothetical protein
MSVAESKSPEQLEHEGFDDIRIDISTQGIEILFKILVAVFEDQSQFLVRVQDIIQSHNILVL